MQIIDRYILRQFLKVLIICFCSLTGLFIVIDVFSNLDEVLRMGEQQGSLAVALRDFYGARALVFFDRTSPLMALLAAAFTVTSLQRSNELAALMAAGISKARVVKPLVWGTVVVSLLGVANRELMIPKYRDRLIREAEDWNGQAKRDMQPRHDNYSGILFSGAGTVAAGKQIVKPEFRFPSVYGAFNTKILAARAEYKEATGQHPGGYLVSEVEVPKSLAGVPSYYQGQEPLLLSPADTDWLEPNQCFVVSDLAFEYLAAGEDFQRYASTAGLIQGLRNPSLGFGTDMRVVVHARMVQPILDVTLLLLGLPMVMSRESRNVFLAAGLCLFVVGAFVLISLTCHALANTFLVSPALAAWLPLIISLPVASVTIRAFWQ